MLPELHNALARLIWERGRISPLEVDVRFEAPTREQVAECRGSRGGRMGVEACVGTC